MKLCEHDINPYINSFPTMYKTNIFKMRTFCNEDFFLVAKISYKKVILQLSLQVFLFHYSVLKCYQISTYIKKIIVPASNEGS